MMFNQIIGIMSKKSILLRSLAHLLSNVDFYQFPRRLSFVQLQVWDIMIMVVFSSTQI